MKLKRRSNGLVIREVRTLLQEMLFALRSSCKKEHFINSREVHSEGGGAGGGERAAGAKALGGEQACSRELEIRAEIREVGRALDAKTQRSFYFVLRAAGRP